MTSVNMANHSFWLTDKLSPYFTAENNLEKLLEYSNRIMSANVGILDKGLRGIMNIIEYNTDSPINKLHYFVGCSTCYSLL